MRVSVFVSKTYALRSMAGGVLANEKGEVLETLEPGQQLHVTALEPVWVLPDDCQMAMVNFKQAARELGLLAGGDKLSNYEVVEFFQTDKTNYVDILLTGHLASNGRFDDTYEIDFQVEAGRIGYMSIMGFFEWGGAFDYLAFVKGEKCLYVCNNRSYRVDNLEESFMYERHFIKWTQNTRKIEIDGTTYATNDWGGGQTQPLDNITIYIGGMHSYDAGREGLRWSTQTKFFSFKMWRSTGELVADLVPVKRKSDSYPGMWCKVRKLFLPMQYATTLSDLTDEDWEQLNAMESGADGIGSMAL